MQGSLWIFLPLLPDLQRAEMGRAASVKETSERKQRRERGESRLKYYKIRPEFGQF
jgi:hypothetical protein